MGIRLFWLRTNTRQFETLKTRAIIVIDFVATNSYIFTKLCKESFSVGNSFIVAYRCKNKLLFFFFYSLSFSTGLIALLPLLIKQIIGDFFDFSLKITTIDVAHTAGSLWLMKIINITHGLKSPGSHTLMVLVFWNLPNF